MTTVSPRDLAASWLHERGFSGTANMMQLTCELQATLDGFVPAIELPDTGISLLNGMGMGDDKSTEAS